MKNSWVASLCAITVTTLYFVLLYTLGANPLNDFIRLLNGQKFNFISLISPFIYITFLYYSIIVPQEIAVSKAKQKSSKIKQKLTNVSLNDKNLPKSVLGKSETNPSEVKTALQLLQERLELTQREQEQALQHNYEAEQVENIEDPLKKRQSELEASLNKQPTPSVQLVAHPTVKREVKVVTLFKDEEPLDPKMAFILPEVNASGNEDELDGTAEIAENIGQEENEATLEFKKNNEMEEINIEREDIITEIEAKHVAEILEDGNSLFIEKQITSKRQATYSMLDKLTQLAEMDTILNTAGQSNGL